MSTNSVAHSTMKNQQTSSWIDESFERTASVKGMTNMSNERRLAQHAEQMVAHYGRYEGDQYELILHELPEDEQNELVRLFMETSDRETGECVHGDNISIENEYTCALLSMLKNNCKDTREHFAEVTRKNIITYYSKSLQNTLDDACNTYIHMVNNEQGYYAHIEMEHGDVVWGRF